MDVRTEVALDLPEEINSDSGNQKTWREGRCRKERRSGLKGGGGRDGGAGARREKQGKAGKSREKQKERKREGRGG